MGPVLALWNGRSIVELSVRTGVNHRNFGRWLRHGVPDRSADRLGMALGLGPESIWPEWYAGEGSPEIIDYVARGDIRQADLRRRRSLASGSAKPRRSSAVPGQETTIPPAQPPAPLLGPPSARSAGYSDDLVYIFPEWLANSPNPPGLPPRKEETVLCECGLTDDLGRPLHIGWCCRDNCERRPA